MYALFQGVIMLNNRRRRRQTKPRGRIDPGRLLRRIDQLEMIERIASAERVLGHVPTILGVSAGIYGSRRKANRAKIAVLSTETVLALGAEAPVFQTMPAPRREGSRCFLLGYPERGDLWSGPFIDSPIKKYAKMWYRDRFFQAR